MLVYPVEYSLLLANSIKANQRLISKFSTFPIFKKGPSSTDLLLLKQKRLLSYID